MELKGDKILRYKLILNGKLPGFETGTPGGFIENIRFSVPPITQDMKKATPFSHIRVLDQFDTTDNHYNAAKDIIAGPINTVDDPYTQNQNKKGLIPGEQVDPKIPEKKKIDASDAIEGINALSTFMSIAEPRDASELSQYAKDVEGSVAGISYKKKSPIYKDGKLPGYVRGRSVFGDMFKGVGAGFLLGGPIAAIGGGILGGAYSILAGLDEEDTIKAINRHNAAYNYGNYNGALSTAIQQANAVQYGDTRNGYLRPYKCGKLPGYSNGVESIDGSTNNVQNAWGQYGEIMYKQMPDGSIMTHEIGANKDVKPSKRKGDHIRLNVGKDVGILNKEDVNVLKRTGSLPAAIAYSQMRLGGFKNGRLPGFANGRWDNFATSLASGVAGLSLYLQAMNDTPYKPNTYASNPYEKKALNDLYGLRANVYPILPSIYDAQAKGMYAISNSGGLSGGQRTLARLAATSGTQQNIANMLLNAQNQNNQYLAQAANASLTAGNNAAQRRMQANQFDLDYFSKAHAARQQGMQMGLYNMVNSLQNYYKNKNKWDMFAMSHKLYSDELEAKKKGLIS